MDLLNESDRFLAITVVSGRASALKCSGATLVQVRRPVLTLEIKKLSNIKVSDKVSQGIETINERQFLVSVLYIAPSSGQTKKNRQDTLNTEDLACSHYKLTSMIIIGFIKPKIPTANLCVAAMYIQLHH